MDLRGLYWKYWFNEICIESIGSTRFVLKVWFYEVCIESIGSTRFVLKVWFYEVFIESMVLRGLYWKYWFVEVGIESIGSTSKFYVRLTSYIFSIKMRFNKKLPWSTKKKQKNWSYEVTMSCQWSCIHFTFSFCLVYSVSGLN